MKSTPRTLAVVVAALATLAASALFAQPKDIREPSEIPPALDAPKPEPTDGPVIKLALLLDTSNSMDGLINQARSRLWKVVNEVGKARVDGKIPQLQVALFQYGNSGLPKKDDFIQLRCPFTTDLDIVSEQLFSLSTNGGSEYCGAVIRESNQRLDWGRTESSPTLRIIVIAGNEPFNQGTEPYAESIATARGMDIKVNTIYCGDREEGRRTLWAEGAELGEGYYASIDQNEKLPDIPTPFDETLENLNDALNATYLGYGDEGAAGKARQVEQDQSNRKLSLFGSFSRMSAKASTNYRTSSWDIVSAVKEGEVDLAELEDEELPESMRDKTLEEKMELVDSLAAKRKKVAAEIQDISEKRRAFVTKARQEAAESGTALDDALIAAMKDQARDIGFRFED